MQVSTAVRAILFGTLRPTYEGRLAFSYKSREEIPEKFRDLYSEADGEFTLNVEGAPGRDDVARLQESLRKERNDHKAAKHELAKWKDVGESPDALRAKLERIDELEIAAEGKIDDAKLEQLVEKRTRAKLATFEREKRKAEERAAELEQQNGELTGQLTRGKIESAVRRVAEQDRVQPTAIEDMVLLAERTFTVAEDGAIVTKDGAGAAAGLTPEAWLKNMRQARPHWWPPSQGGGATGGGTNGGGKNPWSRDSWNMTEQGRMVRELGVEQARRLAQSVGSDLGRPEPTQAAPGK